MIRDLFRGLIRVALVICLMVSCTEAFYFMGKLSNNSHDRYNPYHNSNSDYYNRSSTMETVDTVEDDYEQDTTRTYTQQEYEY